MYAGNVGNGDDWMQGGANLSKEVTALFKLGLIKIFSFRLNEYEQWHN